MILTAHQPVYLPWLGLFHKIALADKFVSFNQVQFLPKDWNNRNRIKTPSGPIWLTVPVLKSGHREKPLTQIEINNSLPWQRKHWKSLLWNYQKTPYFKRYADFFEDVYLHRSWRFLASLNDHMLKWFLLTLGIDTPVADAETLGFEGRKNKLVLDMCKKLKADIYVFGELGRNYADPEAFRKNGIHVCFQTYRPPVYQQSHGEFIQNLSIVDLLFNIGPKSLEVLMSGNMTRENLLSCVETGVT